MTIVQSNSEVKPLNMVEVLGNDWYAVRICDAIEQTDDEYNFISYRDTFRARSYGELLAGIIHTRYSYDDETNLINDYLERGENDKYTAYREIAAWAKAQAKEIKGVT